MTMHAHTRTAIPSKPLTIWVSGCWNILPTAHLFGPLKNALRGRRFSTEKDVREAVHKWLHDQTKTFLEGIRKLVDRWTKRVEKGDYVEKLRTFSGLHLCK